VRRGAVTVQEARGSENEGSGTDAGHVLRRFTEGAQPSQAVIVGKEPVDTGTSGYEHHVARVYAIENGAAFDRDPAIGHDPAIAHTANQCLGLRRSPQNFVGANQILKRQTVKRKKEDAHARGLRDRAFRFPPERTFNNDRSIAQHVRTAEAKECLQTRPLPLRQSKIPIAPSARTTMQSPDVAQR